MVALTQQALETWWYPVLIDEPILKRSVTFPYWLLTPLHLHTNLLSFQNGLSKVTKKTEKCCFSATTVPLTSQTQLPTPTSSLCYRQRPWQDEDLKDQHAPPHFPSAPPAQRGAPSPGSSLHRGAAEAVASLETLNIPLQFTSSTLILFPLSVGRASGPKTLSLSPPRRRAGHF